MGAVNRGLNHHAIPAECGGTRAHTSRLAVHRSSQNGGEINSDLCSRHGKCTCEEAALYEEVIQILPPSQYVDLTINPQSEREADSVCSSGYVFPENGSRASPYEEVRISPLSAYSEPNRNPQDPRETDSVRSSGYVIPGDRVSLHEEVKIWPPSEYVEFKRNLPRAREINSDHSSACVNPTNSSRTSPCKKQKISPLSMYIELNRNPPGAREVNSDHAFVCVKSANSGRAPYEDVKISPPPGYTELDKNKQRQDRKNHEYQKLLKHGSGYVIPLGATEPPTTTTSGYTQLDDTKREQKDDTSYQKLIQK